MSTTLFLAAAFGAYYTGHPVLGTLVIIVAGTDAVMQVRDMERTRKEKIQLMQKK
jgi:hypothetical protein